MNLDKENQGILPNLLIIGAMKGGTSSLHYYLGLHPDIYVSKTKELNFFSEESNWKKGLNWYSANFRKEYSINCEASPSYTIFPFYKNVPKRIFEAIPNTKLIYIVRDPIKRIISQHQQQIALNYQKEDFKTAIKLQSNDNYYLRISNYYLQIKQYLAFFPKNQLLVISSEELAKKRYETLLKIFEFIGVKPFFSPNFNSLKHQTKQKRKLTETGEKIWNACKILNPIHSGLEYQVQRLLTYPFSTPMPKAPIISEDIYQFLKEQLGDDLQKFRELIGRDFSDWSI